MKTLILPGYSFKNRDWANQTKDDLIAKNIPADTFEWEHWSSEIPETSWAEWIEKEKNRISKHLTGESINILAKSMGTAVAMSILKSQPKIVSNIILCGIPLTDLDDIEKQEYNVLKDFPVEKILCIQNDNDNHGGYSEAKVLLNSINPSINIISKVRSNHDYPCTKDFVSFLQK